MNTALQRRNRRIRAALRRIAADRGDIAGLALLEQGPAVQQPDPDRLVVTGYVSTYTDWAPGELVEAFGR